MIVKVERDSLSITKQIQSIHFLISKLTNFVFKQHAEHSSITPFLPHPTLGIGFCLTNPMPNKIMFFKEKCQQLVYYWLLQYCKLQSVKYCTRIGVFLTSSLCKLFTAVYYANWMTTIDLNNNWLRSCAFWLKSVVYKINSILITK